MSMDEPRRPDPDALLAATQRPGRGRLKVFLGMSPGVGKTFEMLRAARRRKAEGGDVVVGVVDVVGVAVTMPLISSPISLQVPEMILPHCAFGAPVFARV